MQGRSFSVELTKTQKTLIYGLTLFPVTEENQEAIFLFLYEDEAKMEEMIKYLVQNEKATEQEIMTELARILKEN